MTAKKAGTKSASKSASKGARKSSSRKGASKNADQSARDKALLDRAKDAPIGGNVLGNEPLGPGVEHEDHEGGETDSLARRGVRGPITPIDERDDKAKEAITGAPSVRERQTAPFANQGGARRARPDAVGTVEKANAKDKAKKVVVIATRTGFYPADGRTRRRGDVFEYTMGPKETKLPSWMIARDGGYETRDAAETSDAFDNEPAAVLEVSKRGEVTQR
jgi:hypothetical protein